MLDFDGDIFVRKLSGGPLPIGVNQRQVEFTLQNQLECHIRLRKAPFEEAFVGVTCLVQ